MRHRSRPDPVASATRQRPLFRCPECGKKAYDTKAAAKRGGRRLYPGITMRAYNCPGTPWWHLTSQGTEQTTRMRDWYDAHPGDTDMPLPRSCLDCGAVIASGSRCPPHQAVIDRRRDAQRGTTATRGYGAQHQQERARRLAQWKPGDPCARCRKPMWNKNRIDLGHTDDRTGYRGLEHDTCNRGGGGT